ncbi:calcium-permeable channel component Mid1 [Amblyomma americanum]
MPLAPRHGTAPWEALLGRLVLCAALCVVCCRGELPPAAVEAVPQFRPSARCNASCGAVPAASCSAPPARLPFCTHLPMRRLLLDAGSCRNKSLERALQGDQLACQLACEFRALLSRFDCLGGYSAKWNCHTCAVVYREWTCAMLVPVYGPAAAASSGRRKTADRGSPAAAATAAPTAPTEEAPTPPPVRPCRQFCHRVEEQCPYFHPAAKEQYAGEPVFICIDPNIPDLPSISNSSYGPPGDCYEPCHVNATFTDDRPCSPDGYGEDHLALDYSSTAATAPPPSGDDASAPTTASGGVSGAGCARTPCGGLSVTAVVVTVWWAAGRTRGRHRLCS